LLIISFYLSGLQIQFGFEIKRFKKHCRIKMKKQLLYLLSLSLTTSLNAQRLMENLDRGVVAVRHAADSVFISWRLLGTEPEICPSMSIAQWEAGSRKN
jgi:hypothetical protein